MSHIRILFLTFIWKFAPELIRKGYIYAAIPPLYKIMMGNQVKYLKDDAALNDFRKSTSKSFELGRMKGYEASLAPTHFSSNQRGLQICVG